MGAAARGVGDIQKLILGLGVWKAHRACAGLASGVAAFSVSCRETGGLGQLPKELCVEG